MASDRDKAIQLLSKVVGEAPVRPSSSLGVSTRRLVMHHCMGSPKHHQQWPGKPSGYAGRIGNVRDALIQDTTWAV